MFRRAERLLFLFAVLTCIAVPRAHASDSSEMNFRFSPIGLVFGAVSVDLDFKVDPNWTVGPEISYWHLSDDESGDFSGSLDLTAFAVGARANWFMNGAFHDGLYVGPSLAYATASATAKDIAGNSLSAKATLIEASCLVGYGWFWDSFNMMLGGGISIPLGDSKVTITDSIGDQISANAVAAGGLDWEFSLGFTF